MVRILFCHSMMFPFSHNGRAQISLPMQWDNHLLCDVSYLFSVLVYSFQGLFHFAVLVLASLMKSVMLLSPNWSLISGIQLWFLCFIFIGSVFCVTMFPWRLTAYLLHLKALKYRLNLSYFAIFETGKMSTPKNHQNFMKLQITQRRGQMFGSRALISKFF